MVGDATRFWLLASEPEVGDAIVGKTYEAEWPNLTPSTS
jgi:hypothetical protein